MHSDKRQAVRTALLSLVLDDTVQYASQTFRAGSSLAAVKCIKLYEKRENLIIYFPSNHSMVSEFDDNKLKSFIITDIFNENDDGGKIVVIVMLLLYLCGWLFLFLLLVAFFRFSFFSILYNYIIQLTAARSIHVTDFDEVLTGQ